MKKDETKTKPETKDCVQEESNEEVRQSTVFFESWHSSIDMLPTEREKLKAYRYILNYSFYKELPEEQKSLAYMIFNIAKPSIDSAQKRYDTAVENGKKGGRPKEIDESKIYELKDRGMTNKAIAEKLRISTKSVSRALDKRQNHNVNDNDDVYVDVNDNDDVNENSDGSKEPESTPTPPQVSEIEKDNEDDDYPLSYEEENKIIKLWNKRIKPKEIVKRTGFSDFQVNNTIDKYKENGYKLPKPKEIIPDNKKIPRYDGSLSIYTKEDFDNFATSSKEELKDIYPILIDEDGLHKFDPEYVAKWFKEDYDVDVN